MKVAISVEIENSLNFDQINENVKRAMNAGAPGNTAAEQIKAEFDNVIVGYAMAKDLNGNPNKARVTDVSVYANNDGGADSLVSEWHKEVADNG